MILNISSRTDIVAFYSKWFINRLNIGFVDVRNPIYPKKVSRIYFKDVDLIVFCTKNPIPIIPYLKDIKIPIIFQITLTPYKKDIEPNVINKLDIIDGIKKISKIIGKDNVYVRYDPILINDKYNLEYHKKSFYKLCSLLNNYINGFIISFIDIYKNVLNNSKYLNLKTLNKEDYELIGESLGNIAKEFNISIQTCFENIDLSKYNIKNTPCLSKELAYQKTNKKYKLWSARKCGCVEMVDIGAYNTCLHLCKYCYANYLEKTVIKNYNNHFINSSMLIGELNKGDEIKIRKN